MSTAAEAQRHVAKRKNLAARAVPRGKGQLPRHRNPWLDRFGWYEVLQRPIRSSTRQIAGLFLGVSAAPTSYAGIFIGKEQHTGWPFFHDVFAAYQAKLITSPNVVVFGAVGAGKSSFLKTWAVLRQLLLGRRVVVIDKKRQQRGTGSAQGEYAQLARALGIEPIRFVIGGELGTKINVLDPHLAGSHIDGDGGASQMQLLRAVLREALGRRIKPMEGRALAVAREVAITEAQAAGRIADVRDVVRHLEDPQAEALEFVPSWVRLDDIRRWGQEAGAELGRLVREDMKGLIDGPTSADVSLSSGLTVFDVSALPDDGPAVPIVMAIINSWLRAVLDSQTETVPTAVVIEEGWHLVDGSFAKVTKRNQKIARGEALMNVTAFHHISDVDEKSPAIAAIKEAGTVVMYGQDKLDDAKRIVELFNLPTSTIETLLTLPQGTALIKVGSHKPVLVTHMRSAWERALTDTDDAMTSTGMVDLHGVELMDLTDGET